MKVFIIAAVTADGFIGQDSEHTADWTGSEDKKVFVRLTKEAGTMIMGSRTFDTIGRALPGRRTIIYTSRPDTYANVDGVETTNESPEKLIARLEDEGIQSVAICGGTSIYDMFMRSGLVTELYLTVTPIVFGTGVRLFANPLSNQLQLLENTTLGDGAVLLHYATKA
jgi:dihydrofolate reductase